MLRVDGYRYIRSYRLRRGLGAERFALYEVQGGKVRRVGTATDYSDARAFLSREVMP